MELCTNIIHYQLSIKRTIMASLDWHIDGRPLILDIPLRHHRQQYNWDCGLASIQMILPDDVCQKFQKHFQSICKAEGFNKSTWTIDLCYLLKKFCIPHEFYTQTLGAHHGYRNASFYEDAFGKDEQRVNQRFRNAHRMGVHVCKATLTLEFVLERLRFGPAIVLTNANLLMCGVCKRNKIASEIRKCLPIFPAYEGHYIVLCGYNLQKQIVHYRNPAYFDHQCSMAFHHFEDARKAFGTDEDIIFINNVSVMRTNQSHSSF